VDARVGNVRNNDPNCVERYEPINFAYMELAEGGGEEQ
jgi:hypothetical protein